MQNDPRYAAKAAPAVAALAAAAAAPGAPGPAAAVAVALANFEAFFNRHFKGPGSGQKGISDHLPVQITVVQ